MYILPYRQFKIKEVFYEGQIIHQFIPLPHILAILADMHKCVATINSYIRRTIKQIGRPPLTILIPRISLIYKRNFKKKVKTHVLLPEFCTPYSNYTAKSVCIVKPELIPHETKKKLPTKVWDFMVKQYHSLKYSAQVAYVRSRNKNLHFRFTMIGTEFIMLCNHKCGNFYLRPRDAFLRFFYFSIEKNWFINILEYLNHTISLSGP